MGFESHHQTLDRRLMLRSDPVTLDDLRGFDGHFVYNGSVVEEAHAKLIIWMYNEDRKKLMWRLRRLRARMRDFADAARDVWVGRHL